MRIICKNGVGIIIIKYILTTLFLKLSSNRSLIFSIPSHLIKMARLLKIRFRSSFYIIPAEPNKTFEIIKLLQVPYSGKSISWSIRTSIGDLTPPIVRSPNSLLIASPKEEYLQPKPCYNNKKEGTKTIAVSCPFSYVFLTFCTSEENPLP